MNNASHTSVPHSALVTGATGFVGHHLVRALLSQGVSVHVVTRAGSNLTVFKGIPAGTLTIRAHDGSIDSLVAIMREAMPDVVFHCAASVVAEHSATDIDDLARTNILFGMHLAEASVVAGVRKFVNTGTFWQHFNDETYNPANLYAATKQAFEDILRYYAEATALRTVTLELSDTYGPRDRRNKLLPLLHRADMTGETLDMTAGDQLIDLVHVDDVVAAYLLAARMMETPCLPGRKFSVSSCNTVRLKDIVALYESIIGHSLPMRWGGRPYRTREIMAPWHGDLLPGWRPRIGLEEGLRELVRSYGNDAA